MMKQSYSRSCHKDVSPNTFLENLQQNSLNTFFLLFRYIILFMSNALKKSKSLQNALNHAEIFSRFFKVILETFSYLTSILAGLRGRK